jgi:hypothetical protein
MRAFAGMGSYGCYSPLSGVSHRVEFPREARSVQSHTNCCRLFFAHPAIINPDGKEAKKTSIEIARRSIEIIYSSFNNKKPQDVWIFLADE